jgi:hypothetical protein
VGYRNNKRMQLFHTCVAHTMDQAMAAVKAEAAEEAEEEMAAVATNKTINSSAEQPPPKPAKERALIRQQEAMAIVLQSPVGQYVRVRYYSPDFFCSDRKSGKLEDYMVWKKQGKVRDTPCLFIHSHDISSRRDLCY